MGLKLLLEWLENPSIYEWIKLESADLDEYKVNGLDDVTAKTSDGKYILHQVKFSIDAKRPDIALTFDWLLKSKETGTSFIYKWADSFFNVPIEKIAEAKLLTNRVPDAEFLNCLSGNLLDFDKIPCKTQERIVEQLGGEERVRLFFSHFEFTHSQRDIENLSLTLEEQFCRNHTNHYGWLKLVTEVWKWSGWKDYPDGKGKIRLHHVRDLLDHKLARPMPQEFEIPDGYSPPTDEFHDGFLQKCLNITDGEVEVLWGSPGRGKSTYLSYLTECLKKQGIHVLRHHFFLSLSDDTVGRWEYRNVVSTLIHQINSVFDTISIPSDDASISGKLRGLLMEAAQVVKEDNKPLILILDGLDHVYRDRGEIHSLNSLFEEIFPVPDNVILLIGTQKVSDERLPKHLLQNKDKESWEEIPLLGVNAVKTWLKIRLDKIKHRSSDDDEKMSELSVALQEKSSGHPLYLIYSFNFLEIHYPSFDTEDISFMPECPEGDIEKYYALLWLELSSEARTILHMFALSGFIWPAASSLVECMGNPIVTLRAYAEIEHLIEKRAVGLEVFHGSILVFCRRKDKENELSKTLYPLIISWVRTKAPEIIKQSWLWLLEAEFGEVDNLISCPSRHWLSTSILNGISQNQIIYILTKAEEIAFYSGNYARALTLRIIKTRLDNSSYQGQEYDELIATTLAIPENLDGLRYALDDLKSLTEADLVMAAKAGFARDEDIAEECINEMNSRVEIANYFNHHHTHQRTYDPCVIAALAALSKKARTERVIPFSLQYSSEMDGIINRFMQEAIHFNKREKCIQLLNYPEFVEDGLEVPLVMHKIIGTQGMRAVLLEGCSIMNVPGINGYRRMPFIACVLSNEEVEVSQPPIPIPAEIEEHALTIDKQIYYDHFFSSLFALMTSSGNIEFFNRQIKGDKEGFITDALKALDQAAVVAGKSLEGKEVLNPLYFYGVIWNLFPRDNSGNYDYYRFQTSLSLALPAIAFDLSLLSGWKPSKDEIETGDLNSLTENLWWNWEVWTDFQLEYGLDICSKEMASEIVNLAKEDIKFRSDSIAELADSQVNIAQWQFHNDLHSECAETMYIAHRNFTGYGYRKDPSMDDLLDTIEYFIEFDIDILPWLKRIEHIVLNILEFTDGKGTHHTPRMYMDLISKVIPSRLYILYSHEQEKENWNNCDHILKLLARCGDYKCLDIKALINTAGDYSVYQEIKQRAELNEPEAVDMLRNYSSIWGHYYRPTSEKSKGTPHFYVDPPTDVSIFGPDKLVELVEELNSLDRAALEEHHYYKNETAIRKWFTFWGKAGKTDTLLETLSLYIEEVKRIGHEVSRSLDILFEVVLDHLGKDEAFKILVMEHRLNHGWSRFYSGGAKSRVERAAEIYPDRWKEFIESTSTSTDNTWGAKYGISIGSELLVFFLLKVGQLDLATEVAEAMVSQIEQDVEMLDLNSLEWPND